MFKKMYFLFLFLLTFNIFAAPREKIERAQSNIWQGQMLSVEEKRCSHCPSDTKLKRCRGCLQVSYCCRACQIDDWRNGHKGLCSKSNMDVKKKLSFFIANKSAYDYALATIFPRELGDLIHIEDILELHRLLSLHTLEYSEISHTPGSFRGAAVIWPKNNLQYGFIPNRDVFLANDKKLNARIQLGLASPERETFITRYMKRTYWEKNPFNRPVSIEEICYAFVPFGEENIILTLDEQYIMQMQDEEFAQAIEFARRNIKFFHPDSPEDILRKIREGRSNFEDFDFESYIELSLNRIISELNTALLNSPESAVEHAAAFHSKMVNLHPFFDTNKRLSRLLMNIILIRTGHEEFILDTKQLGDMYNQVCIQSLDDPSLFVDFVRQILSN